MPLVLSLAEAEGFVLACGLGPVAALTCHRHIIHSRSHVRILLLRFYKIKTTHEGGFVLAEAEGFEPPWGCPQTVFKTSYSRGRFRLFHGGLAHFSSLKILITQGFLPRFEPFEPESNGFESNGISKNLSKISHFRENLERT